MKRPNWILLCILLLLLPLYGQEYKTLHINAFVVDLHSDALYRYIKTGRSFEKFNNGGHVNFPFLKQGGVDLQFFALWPNPKKGKGKKMFNQTVMLLDSLTAIFNRNDVTLLTDIKNFKPIAGKQYVAIGLEGGSALENKVENLTYLFKRGVRYMGLTWNNNLSWAGSAKQEVQGVRKGLDSLGVRIVQKMNQLGMMIDVSHVGEQTFYDVLKHSTKPVIASHSSVYALCSHYRNLKDAQIKAIAKNNGVIGVNFFPTFLVEGFAQKLSSIRKQATAIADSIKNRASTEKFNRTQFINAQIGPIYPSLETVIDHIDYIVNLVGDDYVALGSDFDGITMTPAGLRTAKDFPKITKALLKRGYSHASIKKILGENVMRVWRAQ